jgi:hypothetical protein
MNKNNATTNNQAVNKSKTIRWDRINRIIQDGVTKNMDNNEYYFSRFMNTLGEYSVFNTNCLTGMI